MIASRMVRQLMAGPVARGAIASVAVRVAGMGLAFVQAVLTARLLGAEGYGIVAVAMAVVSVVVSTLAVLGLGQLAVREVAQLAARQEWARLRGFLRASLVAVLAASALGAAGVAMVALASDLLAAEFRGTVALAAILVPLFALLALLRGTAQGFGRVVLAQAPGELLRPLLMVGALSAAALWGVGLKPQDVILLAGGAALVAAIAAGTAVRRTLPHGPGSMPASRDCAAAG